MASKVVNISLPEKWGQVIEELSALTSESMASIVNRATIAYLEELVASGLVEKLREQHGKILEN
jgi:hypothetical protein